VLMKFTHNYTLLLLIMLCFLSMVLPIALNADSGYGSIDKGTPKIYPEANYFGMEKYNLTLKSGISSNMKSAAGIYAIQTQSESTTPDTENTLPQSTSINSSESVTNNEVTSNRDLSNNNNSPTGSTGQRSDLTPKATTVRCEGSALCVTGEVVKVINAKTFYVNIQNKVYKVELALIGLPVQYEEAMRAATTFTRNTCLGSTVLIDQDDRQRENAFIAQVYCSPTKNLNALLLNTGYVLLDKSQCETSEFSKLDWAKSHGC